MNQAQVRIRPDQWAMSCADESRTLRDQFAVTGKSNRSTSRTPGHWSVPDQPWLQQIHVLLLPCFTFAIDGTNVIQAATDRGTPHAPT